MLQQILQQIVNNLIVAPSNFMFYKTYGLNQDLTTPTAAVEAHYDQFYSLIPR